MSTAKDVDEMLLENTLKIADSHRENCDPEICNISLGLLAVLLDRANIEMTDEQRRRFL